MAFYLIVFLLFLLQFVYFPIGSSHFEAPKVYLAELSIFLLLLVQLFTGKKIIPKKSVLICFIGILALSIIHVIFLRTETTFFGNSFRLQGVFLLWMLLLFAFLSSKISIIPKLHPIFLVTIIFIQFCFALLIEGRGLDRSIGTLGEPNSLAAMMIFVWPFLYFAKKKIPGVLTIVALAAVLLTIFISGSRSGMIALALQGVFLLCTSVLHFSFKKTTVICLLLLAVTYSLPFVDQASLYENRGEIWQSAVTAGMSHPLFGSGFGNMEPALHQASVMLHNHLPGYTVDSAHNIFLDWFVQGGIVGLGLLVFLLWQTLRTFIHRKDAFMLILLLGLLGALSFNPVSVCLLIAFWWVIGQGL